MSEPLLLLPAPYVHPLRRVLHSIAVPLLLFSVSLSVFIFLIYMIFVPRFQTVEVAGSHHTLIELHSLQASLMASIVDQESKRSTLIFPVREPAYIALREQSDRYSSFEHMRQDIMQRALSLSPAADGIHIDTMQFISGEKHILLTGDVRFMGPRSMTILAQFVESLRGLPFVTEVFGETYTRIDTPNIGLHSPFSLTLTWK